MSETQQGMFDVHLYATVRVKVVNIPATNQIEAIKRAEKETDLDTLLNQDFRQSDGIHVEHAEYADETNAALVDNQADAEYETTTAYLPGGADGWEPESPAWEHHADFPVEDWQHEVVEGNTRRGYQDWVRAMREQQADDMALTG